MTNISRQRDQFYTQNEIAKECVDILLNTVNIDKNAKFLEPSAGEGSFLLPLIERNRSFLALDIEPKHPSIVKEDFLNYNIENLQNIVTIGNPPFGKNSSLAIKFFNKAAQFSNCIAMILPATFNKQSIQNRLDRSMHLLNTYKLSSEFYNLNRNLVKVPTVFQIWIKKEELRIIEKKILSSVHFEFTSKENANFAIQRVGVASGKVKNNFNQCAKSSHYFIKASDTIRDIFHSLDFASVKYNTAGNPSISKTELISLLDKYMKQNAQ